MLQIGRVSVLLIALVTVNVFPMGKKSKNLIRRQENKTIINAHQDQKSDELNPQSLQVQHLMLQPAAEADQNHSDASDARSDQAQKDSDESVLLEVSEETQSFCPKEIMVLKDLFRLQKYGQLEDIIRTNLFGDVRSPQATLVSNAVKHYSRSDNDDALDPIALYFSIKSVIETAKVATIDQEAGFACARNMIILCILAAQDAAACNYLVPQGIAASQKIAEHYTIISTLCAYWWKEHLATRVIFSLDVVHSMFNQALQIVKSELRKARSKKLDALSSPFWIKFIGWKKTSHVLGWLFPLTLSYDLAFEDIPQEALDALRDQERALNLLVYRKGAFGCISEYINELFVPSKDRKNEQDRILAFFASDVRLLVPCICEINCPQEWYASRATIV